MTKPKNPMVTLISKNLTFLFIVALAIWGGFNWNKALVLGSMTELAPNTAQAVPQPQAPAPQTKGVASVDDDPVLGDKNAPITMIEFSDYECPFCKRHFDQTLPQIIEKYVETGKVKIVFRDLPLSFHDPMATKEAIAANCAREQGGDSRYFQYHDEIFKRTKSNGNGLSEANLITIATDLGLNINSFNTCLDDPKQADEVKKDLADASQAGASGTPAFIIGKSTKNGEIEGSFVSGAQPLAVFEAIFEALE